MRGLGCVSATSPWHGTRLDRGESELPVFSSGAPTVALEFRLRSLRVGIMAAGIRMPDLDHCIRHKSVAAVPQSTRCVPPQAAHWRNDVSYRIIRGSQSGANTGRPSGCWSRPAGPPAPVAAQYLVSADCFSVGHCCARVRMGSPGDRVGQCRIDNQVPVPAP
jgi:hypothetical protein